LPEHENAPASTVRRLRGGGRVGAVSYALVGGKSWALPSDRPWCSPRVNVCCRRGRRSGNRSIDAAMGRGVPTGTTLRSKHDGDRSSGPDRDGDLRDLCYGTYLNKRASLNCPAWTIQVRPPNSIFGGRRLTTVAAATFSIGIKHRCRHRLLPSGQMTAGDVGRQRYRLWRQERGGRDGGRQQSSAAENQVSAARSSPPNLGDFEGDVPPASPVGSRSYRHTPSL
jgi:hypothetical protein